MTAERLIKPFALQDTTDYDRLHILHVPACANFSISELCVAFAPLMRVLPHWDSCGPVSCEIQHTLMGRVIIKIIL